MSYAPPPGDNVPLEFVAMPAPDNGGAVVLEFGETALDAPTITYPVVFTST